MTNEKRLIDANEAYEIARTSRLHDDFGRCMADLTSLKELLEDCPTVDAVEVVHGRWETPAIHIWRCSVCKIGVPYSFTGDSYCHNCGAKMGGGA